MPTHRIVQVLVAAVAFAGPAFAQTAEAEFVTLRDAYLARYRPLELEIDRVAWAANISGTDTDFARVRAAQKAIIDVHADPKVFADLKTLRADGQVRDPVLTRELEILYLNFLSMQGDPALVKRIGDLELDVSQIFNTHRSQVGDKHLSENDVSRILATTTDSAAAEAAWKGYMEVGRKAEAKLRELVSLRNELARQLGYDNYFSLALALQELDEQELFRLFAELDELTRAPFAELKRDIDAARAARFSIAAKDLRPWHYGDLFFQEVPLDDTANLDALYAHTDLVVVAQNYYGSIGLPVEDILARSDLYEQPGKCPHAFCQDVDRAGTVRILCNLAPDARWANTILHELGHAVYSRYVSPDVPFLLHTPSHAATTEGIAMLFGALARNEDFLRRVVGIDPSQAAPTGAAIRATLRAERLIFARWSQVMLHFEHDRYTHPDQDWGQLWWNLKQRYQLQNPPESVHRPDYGAKMHILGPPAYHNYLLGELFAAQVRHHIATHVLGHDDAGRSCFYQEPRVGEYLRQEIFAPGNLYNWTELTRRATGEPLTARYYAAQLAQ